MKLIGDVTKRNAKMYPEKHAVIFENESITFKRLNELVNSFANGMIEIGVKKSDRVVLLAENCLEFAVVFFGVAKSGAILVPINYRYNSDEIKYIVENCEAGTIVFQKKYLDNVTAIKDSFKDLNLICIGDDIPDNLLSYRSLVCNYSTDEPNIKIDEHDTINIMYTSGSTAKPKGVVLSHRNHMANAVNWVMELGLNEDDVNLVIPPLFGSGALHCTFFACAYIGATNVIINGYDAQKVLRAVNDHGVTYIYAVPTMFIDLVNFPGAGQYNLSCLRIFHSGSAAIPLEIINRVLQMFPHVNFYNGYGLTEAGPAVTVLKPRDVARKRTTIGRSLINVEVRIVDENNNDVLIGEPGEIICRGDTIMSGYWKNTEATAEALKNGWLYTGDVGRFDEEYYITLVDRKKDIIISGGFNISSVEVEEVLYSHPAVFEACVFGVPHPRWGEAVHAVVSLKEGMAADEEELIDYCKERMASFKKPQRIVFMKRLPQTTYGKIFKRQLREEYLMKVARK